jgi:hypothetical protein
MRLQRISPAGPCSPRSAAGLEAARDGTVPSRVTERHAMKTRGPNGWLAAALAFGALVLAAAPLSCSSSAANGDALDAGVTQEFCGKGTVSCAGGTCPASSSCVSGGCQCNTTFRSLTCDGQPCIGSACPPGGYYCGAAGNVPHALSCPKGTSPCGDGCIPGATSVCCDNGTGKTSSYCANSAGGGCFANTMQCAAALPAGASAQFCCSQNGSAGSNDCPSGQHHCGLSCYPVDHPCCPAGTSSADCPEASWDPSICSLPNPNDVGCAYCVSTNLCKSCPSGECCGGDPCGSGTCTAGPVCVGPGSTTGGDGGGSTTCTGGLLVSTLVCDPLGTGGTSSYCLSAAEYTRATGMPLPGSCAQAGTTGCEGESGMVAGALVKPCCPGLTCRVASACGDPTGAVGGSCQP